MSSWRASSGRLAGNRRPRVSAGQWARARLRGGCVAPHTWQVATPDVGSTSRKLAQPLVRQNGREGDWAATARRRRRRMELARPAYVEVAERDIMGFLVLPFFLARRSPQARWAWAATLDRSSLSRRDRAGAVSGSGGSREHPLWESSTGAVTSNRRPKHYSTGVPILRISSQWGGPRSAAGETWQKSQPETVMARPGAQVGKDRTRRRVRGRNWLLRPSSMSSRSPGAILATSLRMARTTTNRTTVGVGTCLKALPCAA